MGNCLFLSVRSYNFIKILQPTVEFASTSDKKDLFREDKGEKKDHCLSLEHSDAQERTDQKRPLPVISVPFSLHFPSCQ